MGSVEELNDDELALLGAPWAKEGLLSRKIQVEAQGKKPQKKDWKQYFVVIQRGDLHMFVFGSGGGSSMGGGVVGGGNWMANAKTSGEYSLMHAMAMALPKPGYSASRPYCFTVTFPSGEISVFQAGTEELVAEWVATCNYWAARRSRQPLVGGVSNIEYGWTRVLSMDVDDHQECASLRSARSQITRLGAINRVRGQQSTSGSLDKMHINDWKPPPHASMPSTLDEEAQLESLLTYVQSLKEELNQHKGFEELMNRLYTPGSKNANKARDNWTAKSRYIHSEIFKYETYVEALRNAIALRLDRQGQKRLEKALARSTASLHADLRKSAPRTNSHDAHALGSNGAVSPGPTDSITDDGSGYVTADVDEGTPGRAS
jgi:PH/SEC7 domain-containing protein